MEGVILGLVGIGMALAIPLLVEYARRPALQLQLDDLGRLRRLLGRENRRREHAGPRCRRVDLIDHQRPEPLSWKLAGQAGEQGEVVQALGEAPPRRGRSAGRAAGSKSS